jgi:hypothetical protein
MFKSKKVLAIAIISLLVLVSIGFYYVFGDYSEGKRSGYLLKLSKKGVLFKTYEGELVQSGTEDNQMVVTPNMKWQFSVNAGNTALIKKMENLVGQPVRVSYKEKFTQFSWRGDTKYFVYDIERDGELPPMKEKPIFKEGQEPKR